MTTINSQEDFLRALAENPQWKEAVRAQILGEELLQLPARFNAFVERMDVFVEEQRRHNDRMDAFVVEQRGINERSENRFTAMYNDIGQVKGGHARISTIREAPYIVMAMSAAKNLGLKYVRDVAPAELADMAHNAMGGDIPANELHSFARADLVIEAADADGAVSYIAVEASFTSDLRDTSRAQRNASLLTRFTGRPAHAVVSSVHNDRHAAAEIDAGSVWWNELEQRDMETE